MAARNNVLNCLSEQEVDVVYGRRLRNGEIRILDLSQGNSARPTHLQDEPQISCQLRIVKLSNKPQFVALSYCWGDTSQTACVNINGITFRVTRSAFTVLKILLALPASVAAKSKNPANLFRGIPIWLDAICINQVDIPEQEAQVSSMRTVYASADSTLAYLGKPATSQNDRLAMDWLNAVASQDTYQIFLDTPSEVRMRMWRTQSWDAVCELVGQPWFRRRWVVQEAAVSKEVWVVYGTEILRWETFSSAIERCLLLFDDMTKRPSFQTIASVPAANLEPTLAIARLRLHRSQRLPAPRLLDLMVRYRRSDSMHAEDRIFAMLGLCGEKERKANPVDYSIGPLKVLRNFVLEHIRIFRDLDILNICTQAARMERPGHKYTINNIDVWPDPWDAPRTQYIQNLPSWVPNVTSFRAEWLLGPSLILYRGNFQAFFNAAAGCPGEIPDLNYAEKQNILAVRGIEIDRIQICEPNLPVKYPETQNPHAPIYTWLWNFASYGLVPEIYASEEARFTGFLRTLTGGGRYVGTDEEGSVSDAYLRHFAMVFFSGTSLQRTWINAGLRADLPPNPADWYIPRKTNAPADWLPKLLFDKLYWFKLARGYSGRIGLVPPHTQPGDCVAVLFGCSSPLLLTECPYRAGHFVIRGEAYVDGMMFGKSVQMWKQGRLKSSVFNLI